MSIRSQIVGIGFAVFLCSPCSYAQESLPGIYKGFFTALPPGGSRSINVGLSLEIFSAADGKLAGKVIQLGGQCRGEYTAAGTYEGANIDIKVAEGAIRGCGNTSLIVVAQGNKLVGKLGSYSIELSK